MWTEDGKVAVPRHEGEEATLPWNMDGRGAKKSYKDESSLRTLHV